jgi:hypothetical protein
VCSTGNVELVRSIEAADRQSTAFTQCTHDGMRLRRDARGSSPCRTVRSMRWRLPDGCDEGCAVSQTHDLTRNLRQQFPRQVVAHAGVADESCTGNGARQS